VRLGDPGRHRPDAHLGHQFHVDRVPLGFEDLEVVISWAMSSME